VKIRDAVKHPAPEGVPTPGAVKTSATAEAPAETPADDAVPNAAPGAEAETGGDAQ
jgi:hypothetical protein